MADIASLLAKEGLVLERPGTNTAPVVASTTKKRKTVDFEETSTRKTPPPRKSPASQSSLSSVEESESEQEKSPAMPSRSIIKSPRPKRSDLEDAFADMSIGTPVVIDQTISGILPVPVLSGRWEKFNHKKGIMEGFALMRIFLPNGSDDVDIEFSWVDPRCFKIRIKWPVFMVSSLMTTNLDITEVDINGVSHEMETYPEGHPIYDSMGVNAARMKKDGRDIWSEGVFRFEKDMLINYEEKLFEVTCKNGDKGTLLQIKFYEEPDIKKNVSTPMSKVKRTIQYSKSPPTNPNERDPTRQYSPRRQASKRGDESPTSIEGVKRMKTNNALANPSQRNWWVKTKEVLRKKTD